MGTTFTVNLPLAPGVDTPGAASEDLQGWRVDLAVLRGLSIMVVDDDADFRELLATTLSYQGSQVTAVASVAEARRIFFKEAPDVLVCDIALPDEDGCALIAGIRSRPTSQGGAVPAIAVSALVQAEDRARALAAGFQKYVAKPVDPLKVAALIAVLRHGPTSTDPG